MGNKNGTVVPMVGPLFSGYRSSCSADSNLHCGYSSFRGSCDGALHLSRNNLSQSTIASVSDISCRINRGHLSSTGSRSRRDVDWRKDVGTKGSVEYRRIRLVHYPASKHHHYSLRERRRPGESAAYRSSLYPGSHTWRYRSL